MIFLTVGNELAFPRLINAVDKWCAGHPKERVFGQIGPLVTGESRPNHFEWVDFVSPEIYRQKLQESKLIIGHAGTGTIIAALTVAKPVIIMPRRVDRRECRNNHQIATAKKFGQRKGIFVAGDETELIAQLNRYESIVAQLDIQPLPPFAEAKLITTIREFIFNN